MRCFNNLLLISLLATPFALLAQDAGDASKADDNGWSVHFQFTAISQSHFKFKAAYSGPNSLADTAQFAAQSISSTLYLGRKLWPGAAVYFNPEISGGAGLSYALGVAGALNGETYRVGAVQPELFIARAYLQQMIPLGSNTGYVDQGDEENQVAGVAPSKRLVISAGKFSVSDFYDNNQYSHDPRVQLFNWSLWANGAWDYPANTRGYTEGLVAEFINDEWGAVRLSTVAVPVVANHPDMEYVFGKAQSETLEVEKNIQIARRSGTIRVLLSHTDTRAPSYAAGLAALKTGDSLTLNIISGNAKNPNYGGHKDGIYFNGEQEIADNVGFFTRLGWNDGKYASWAFTEIDRTANMGLSIGGKAWRRPEDIVCIATVFNGISAQHREFLKDGGLGFILGDGTLNYGLENITEFYYSAQITSSFWLTADYQFVNHPGYNKDRGPVNVFGFRGHIEL